MRKIQSKNILKDSIIRRIEKSIVDDNIRFYICYHIPFGNDSLLDSTKEEMRINKKNIFTINIGFPGNVMTLYEYYKEREGNLTKIEYFLRQIELINKVE